MKRLMLQKNLSNEALNAYLPCFVASPLSTLYESMLKSPYNNNERFSGIRESKDEHKIWLCYDCFKMYHKNFKKIANIDHRLITFLL
jgi:hypothetical protein